MQRLFVAGLVALAAALPGVAQAAGWGSIKGKFVIEGNAPEAEKLAITKDQAVCGKHGLVDESILVGEDGGIANVVIGLYLRPGSKATIHPDLEKPQAEAVEMDNTKCRFEPHITLMRTGQALVLSNTDPVGHNVKADLLKNPPFNILVPQKSKLEVKNIKTAETLPMPVSCSIHPWMRGYIYVTDHPYVAVSAEDGTFEIKNLPAGKVTLRAWQEKSGYIKEVEQGGKKEKWTAGRFEVTIKDGETLDLGEVKIDAKAFK